MKIAKWANNANSVYLARVAREQKHALAVAKRDYDLCISAWFMVLFTVCILIVGFVEAL